MNNIIKLTIVCAFLFSFSALSVNAQTCTDPNCPFNTDNVSMTGPVNMIYMGGYGFYSLPNVSGASYVWSSSFLKNKNHGGTPSIAEFAVPPEAGGSGYNFCYYEWNTQICFEYAWWYPRDTIDVIECTVTYNGHEHYFWKKVFIWKDYWNWP